MIGLKRGTVTLCDHDPEWENEGRAAVNKIKSILGEAAVDTAHTGSTAIRGICAKPIIDITIGLRNLDDILPFNSALEAAGFVRRPHADRDGQLFYAAGDFESDFITHHIHAVVHGGREWTDYINFRDFLNSHLSDAQKYDALKRRLCGDFSADRAAYTAAKSEFIARTLTRARAWSYLGREVDIVIDRPLGSTHPKHPDIVYTVNYGYVPHTDGGDAEELDVYLVGVGVPVRQFVGRVFGVVYRENDDEDKLIALPLDPNSSAPVPDIEQIWQAVEFQEKYFTTHLEVYDGIHYQFI